MGVYEEQIVPIDLLIRRRKRKKLCLDAPAAIAQFRAYKTYDQLSFHTKRVISALKFLESYEVKE